MVPHLTTAHNGPINELEQRILESMPAIERWFRLEWMEHTPPFYTSADLRNAGFKLAPVDNDLFPRTFNNLTREMMPLAVQAAMAAIEKICPEAKNLLLIPDARIANTFYLQNLQRLIEIFSQAGLNVRLGSLDTAMKTPTRLALPDGSELTLEPLVRNRGRLGLKRFDPCTILLNNDLSGGVPRELEHLYEQYLLPPLHAGWPLRRKSRHFRSYEEVAKKFAKLLGLDAWLINPLHAGCGALDVERPAGLEALRGHADALLTKIRRKYKEYGIGDKPYVVVKSDDAAGSGLLALRDAKELDDPARLRRAGAVPAEFVLQEGVPTFERMNDAVADPVVMMVDRYVVGGYYRVHAERPADEDLCGACSGYVPLAFAGASQMPRAGLKPGANATNRFYMYGVVGRLSMLASSYELEATDPEAENYQ